MRTADEREVGIWRLREAGMTYEQIAERAKLSKGQVAGLLHRIRYGEVTLPAPVNYPSGCRWVHGDPRRSGWSWCDAPVIRGGEWCAEHRARVYRRDSGSANLDAGTEEDSPVLL